MRRVLRNLDGIYDCIAHKISEPEITLNLINKIENAILSLETMPYRCPHRKRDVYSQTGYRQLLVENYTTIFRIDEVKKTVIVVTISYSSSKF